MFPELTPDVLRSIIEPVIGIIEAAAKLTKTPIDNVAVSLFSKIINNDAMLAAIAKVLSNLLSAKGIDPTKATVFEIASVLAENQSEIESHVAAVVSA